MAVAVILLASTGVMFTQIDMELMPMSDEGSISISVTTKTGLDIDATDVIMTEVESIVAAQEDVESYSMRGNGGSASLTVYLKDDRSLSTDEFITLMREQTSGIDNASVEVEEQSSMSFGSRGVQVNLSGSNLDTCATSRTRSRRSSPRWTGSIPPPPAFPTAARAPKSSSIRCRPPPSARPPPPSSPPRKT